MRAHAWHEMMSRGHHAQAARMLNKDESELNLIVAHLGAGASITAIKNGKSVDTSMGLTPLEGCAAQHRPCCHDAGEGLRC